MGDQPVFAAHLPFFMGAETGYLVMIRLANSTHSLGLWAFSLIAAVAVWIAAVPAILSPGTFLLIGLVMAGLTTVARLSYNNSQDTGSLGQMLHETELAPVTAVARPGRRRLDGR